MVLIFTIPLGDEIDFIYRVSATMCQNHGQIFKANLDYSFNSSKWHNTRATGAAICYTMSQKERKKNDTPYNLTALTNDQCHVSLAVQYQSPP